MAIWSITNQKTIEFYKKEKKEKDKKQSCSKVSPKRLQSYNRETRCNWKIHDYPML